MMKKFIAPKTITINGRPSPCDCDDTITCAYCVQANLMLMEKKFAEGDGIAKTTIKIIRKNGIRKSARQIGEHEKTIRRWIQTGNIPQSAVKKMAGLRT
jgi:hypothetical protein